MGQDGTGQDRTGQERVGYHTDIHKCIHTEIYMTGPQCDPAGSSEGSLCTWVFEVRGCVPRKKLVREVTHIVAKWAINACICCMYTYIYILM